MLFDVQNMFTGSPAGGSSGSLVFGPTTDKLQGTGTLASSNAISLEAVGGIPALAGRDIGIGDDPALKISVIVSNPFGNAIAGGTSLQLQLQGAVDAGNGTPGTATTLWTSPAFPIALFGTPSAAVPLVLVQLANIDMPRIEDGEALPAFLLLNFIMVGTFTGGGLIEASLMLDIGDQVQILTGPYAGVGYSAYPPGLNFAPLPTGNGPN
jgi:hypothetical protein